MSMGYFEETDPFTGEHSSFGGIAESAAEYHARGEMCPYDCGWCDPEAVQARAELKTWQAEQAARPVPVYVPDPHHSEPPF